MVHHSVDSECVSVLWVLVQEEVDEQCPGYVGSAEGCVDTVDAVGSVGMSMGGGM